MWAINGAPSHADRYAAPALFAKLWEKLLRAAATEALREGRRVRRGLGRDLSDDDAPLGVPSGDEILAWLEGRVLQDPAAAPERMRATEEQLPPRTRVTERRGRRSSGWRRTTPRGRRGSRCTWRCWRGSARGPAGCPFV